MGRALIPVLMGQNVAVTLRCITLRHVIPPGPRSGTPKLFLTEGCKVRLLALTIASNFATTYLLGMKSDLIVTGRILFPSRFELNFRQCSQIPFGFRPGQVHVTDKCGIGYMRV